jgi:hypothetical protein
MLLSPSQRAASTGLRPEPPTGATGDSGRTPPLFVIGEVDRGVFAQYHPQQQEFAAVKKLNTSVSVDELYRKWCIDSNPNTKHKDLAETSLSVMGTPTMMLSSPSSILYPSASNATAASSSAHRHDRRDTSSHLEGLLYSLPLLEYNTPTHQRNHFDAMSTSRYHRTLVGQPPQPPSLLSGAAAATPASARELHAASRALTDRIHHLEVLNHHHHSYVSRQQRATPEESLRDQGARSEASSSSSGSMRRGVVGHRSSNINIELSSDQIHNTVNGAAAPQSGGTDIKDTAARGDHHSRGALSGADALDALDQHSRVGDATPKPTTTTASSTTTAAFLAEQVAALHRDNDALQRHFLETTERHEEERTNALQGMRDRHRRTELQWLEELELQKVRCATLEGSLKDARHTNARLQSRIEELEAAVEREKTHAGVRERELLVTIGGLQRDVTMLSLSSHPSAPTMVTEQGGGGGGGHAPPPSPPRSASVQRLELLRSSSAVVSGDLDSSLDAKNDVLNQTPSLYRAANSVALQFSNDDASNDDTVMIAALADSLLPPSARATAPGSPDALQPLQPPHPDAGQRDALMPMAFDGCGHRLEPRRSTHAARLHADPTSSGSTESDGGGGPKQCPHCAQNQRRLDRARAELVESTQQWSVIAEEVADFASAVLRGVRRDASVGPSASL